MMRALVLVLLVLLLATACAPRTEGGPFGGASPERASELNAELGANYLQEGELQRAKTTLERAIEQNPNNVNAHVTYAILQNELGDAALARRHFRRAMSLESDNPRVHNNYGIFLCEQGEYDQALELMVRAAQNRLYQRPASAWANAGTCAREAGRDAEAREYLRNAVEAEPRAGSAWLALGELEYDAGDAQAATRALDAFHDLTEPTARSLWLAVRVERAQGDSRAADQYGRDLIRQYPDSDEAARFLETR